MSVAIKKINGVESVNVSLNEGLARIRLKSRNQVRLEDVRKVIYNNGFTPKEARVTAQAQLVSTDGKLQVKVTGIGRIYPLVLAPKAQTSQKALQGVVGKTVVVEGIIQPSKDKKIAENFQALNIQGT